MRGTLSVTVTCILVLGCAHPVTRPVSLVPVSERLVESDGVEELYALTFHDPAGREVQAYLRGPATRRPEPGWGVVIVAGRETGREAAAVLPGPIDGMVLAVEYPGEIPDVLDVGAALRALPRIQRVSRRLPGVLRGAGHYLAERAEVNPEQVALIGVSFGVPFAAPAGRDPVFTAVALIYGGGDLTRILDRNLPIGSPVLRRLVAEYGAHVFRELEPLRHVGAISPTPLLLINGTEDEQIPIESALLLKEHARSPVEHIWVPYGHLMPWDFELMRELTLLTRDRIHFLRE